MRAGAVLVAIVLFGLAVPAVVRAERAGRIGSVRRLLWESARCLVAVAAGTALLITALWA